jgi:hypothetical protein
LYSLSSPNYVLFEGHKLRKLQLGMISHFNPLDNRLKSQLENSPSLEVLRFHFFLPFTFDLSKLTNLRELTLFNHSTHLSMLQTLQGRFLTKVRLSVSSYDDFPDLNQFEHIEELILGSVLGTPVGSWRVVKEKVFKLRPSNLALLGSDFTILLPFFSQCQSQLKELWLNVGVFESNILEEDFRVLKTFKNLTSLSVSQPKTHRILHMTIGLLPNLTKFAYDDAHSDENRIMNEGELNLILCALKINLITELRFNLRRDAFTAAILVNLGYFGQLRTLRLRCPFFKERARLVKCIENLVELRELELSQDGPITTESKLWEMDIRSMLKPLRFLRCLHLGQIASQVVSTDTFLRDFESLQVFNLFRNPDPIFHPNYIEINPKK